MNNKIKLYMDDWLINGGIIGFYNILKKSGDEILLEDNWIEFDINSLNNFEEKYFNYFIDTYEKNLTWYKIISYEDKLNYFVENNFENFDEKSLESLNKYISNVLKKFLKSNSYIAAYELFAKKEEILLLEKQISIIKLGKNKKIVDVIEIIKETIKSIKKIIEILKRDEAKKYICAKNVMYSIINNAWNGVSFLNPQTKQKDMYIDYKEYFVTPVINFLKEDNSKYKYSCSCCGSKVKDMKNDLSFLNSIGFDVSRKSSHVWNFNNDIFICPLCKLIYSCVPAGFTYAMDSGIYINEGMTMKSAVKINSKIKSEVFMEANVNNKAITYRAMIQSIREKLLDGYKYEFADIQVVRVQVFKSKKTIESKYTFNILSRNILFVINESLPELEKLTNSGYKEINTNFSIYDIIVDSLLNHKNLYLLMHKMILYKFTNPENCYYGVRQINAIIKINTIFMRRLGYMENCEPEIVDKARKIGYFLRRAYKEKDPNTTKLGGISYRLLNSLKINNSFMFMDTLLNCYLYVNKEFPKEILDSLKDEDVFKTIGYAFVAGLIDEKESGGKKDGE